jgi:hypothetical protein
VIRRTSDRYVLPAPFTCRRALAATALLGMALAACSSGSTTPADTSTSTAPRLSTTSTAPRVPTVAVTTASWTLPRPSSREVVVAGGDHLFVLGGFDGNRQTIADVLRIDARSGSVARVGALGTAVHDAAGALIGGVPMVFGGGNATETAAVQAFGPGASSRTVGRLPIPRSDLGAATVGGRTFLVGGYDGSTVRASVIATTDGATFSVLGDLPVPVRYPAVAAVGTNVYVIGGSNGGGGTRAVQVLDTRTGAVRTIGELPQTLSDAVAATVDGRVYVFGGKWGGRASAQVWRLDVGTAAAPGVALTPVAMLPTAVTDAAVAVVGHRAYLVGGESPAMLNAVSILEVR